MTIHDEDLDRLLRAARPAQVTRDPRLTAADIALREDIIRGIRISNARPARPRLAWVGVTAAVASVVVAVLVAVGILSPGQQAVALTPPPLVYSAAGSLDEVIEDAEQTLATVPGPEQRSYVHSVVWGWSVEMEEERIESVPQDITFDWGPGETATTTILAADPYWTDDERPAGVAPSPYEPGDLIDRVVTAPEDDTTPAEIVTLAGSSREEMLTVLGAFGMTDTSSSGEMLAAIGGLLQYWTLSNAQHATLLQLLVDAGDVDVLGTTTDRLGREVVGLRVSTTLPERTDAVLVSTETGRIVGMENELTEPFGVLPAGVISYTMWDAGD